MSGCEHNSVWRCQSCARDHDARLLAAKDAEIAALKAENARLREALEWYADEDNYTTDELGRVVEHVHFSVGLVDSDAGERARAALGREGT